MSLPLTPELPIAKVRLRLLKKATLVREPPPETVTVRVASELLKSGPERIGTVPAAGVEVKLTVMALEVIVAVKLLRLTTREPFSTVVCPV